MDETYLFCTSCGKQLEPGAMYCPACGAATASASSYENQNYRAGNSEAKEKIKLAGVLLLAGAIISFILGLYSVFAADSFISMMVDVLEGAGYDFQEIMGATPAEYKDMLITSGYVMLLCGAVCLIPGILCFVGRFWAPTLVLSIAATALGFYTTLFGGFIGLIVIWFVYKYRDAFDSGSRL